MNALLLGAWLALSPAQAADPFVSSTDVLGKDWHVRLDADATWGIGSQMYLGAQTHVLGQLPVWHRGGGTGTFDLGLRAAYGNEAQFLAPWIDPTEVTGVPHRLQVQASVGHTFHLTPQRRFALGLHALAGWNMVYANQTLTYANEGVEGSAETFHNDFVASGELTLAWRASRHVGVNLVIDAPLPTRSSYVITMVQVGLGLSFYLK